MEGSRDQSFGLEVEARIDEGIHGWWGTIRRQLWQVGRLETGEGNEA